MSADRVPEISPRILDALDELKRIILGRYPDATFSVGPSPEDPDVVHLYATVDLEDTEELVDLVIDRMMEMQIEDGLPIFVIPERPPERVRQMLAVARRRSPQQGSALLD